MVSAGTGRFKGCRSTAFVYGLHGIILERDGVLVKMRPIQLPACKLHIVNSSSRFTMWTAVLSPCHWRASLNVTNTKLHAEIHRRCQIGVSSACTWVLRRAGRYLTNAIPSSVPLFLSLLAKSPKMSSTAMSTPSPLGWCNRAQIGHKCGGGGEGRATKGLTRFLQKKVPRLRDSASLVPLAAGTTSCNLEQTFCSSLCSQERASEGEEIPDLGHRGRGGKKRIHRLCAKWDGQTGWWSADHASGRNVHPWNQSDKFSLAFQKEIKQASLWWHVDGTERLRKRRRVDWRGGGE